MFGNPMRLLREKWKTPTALAQELYSMAVSQEARQVNAPVEIRAPEKAQALVIRRPQSPSATETPTVHRDTLGTGDVSVRPLPAVRQLANQDAPGRPASQQPPRFPPPQTAAEALAQKQALRQFLADAPRRLAAEATLLTREATPHIADGSPPPSTLPRGPSYPVGDNLQNALASREFNPSSFPASAIPARSSVPQGPATQFRPSQDRPRRQAQGQRETARSHQPYETPYVDIEGPTRFRGPEPVQFDQRPTAYDDKKGTYEEVVLKSDDPKKLFTDIPWGYEALGIAQIGSSDIPAATNNGTTQPPTPSSGNANIYYFDGASQKLKQQDAPGNADTIYNFTNNRLKSGNWYVIGQIATEWFVIIPPSRGRIAYSGGSGIAAMSGSTPGSQVGLQLYDFNGTTLTAAETDTIFNLGTSAVQANKYLIVANVQGYWFVDVEQC